MKKWVFVIPIIILTILIFYLSGYRFTSLCAAKNNSFLSKDAELVEKYNTGSLFIFLFKSDKDEQYQTVLSEKSGLLFRSSATTYIPYSSDKLQTVGGMSYASENGEFTFLSIVSNDEKVAYIEAGEEPEIERKEINKGERISFLYPFSEQIDFLNPTAFDKDGKKLYYYGYSKDTNVFRTEDLRWHKIEEQ